MWSLCIFPRISADLSRSTHSTPSLRCKEAWLRPRSSLTIADADKKERTCACELGQKSLCLQLEASHGKEWPLEQTMQTLRHNPCSGNEPPEWHLLEWGGKRTDQLENPPKVNVSLLPSFDSPGALSRSPLWKCCWSLLRRPPRWRTGTPCPCSARGCGNSRCDEGPGKRAPPEGTGGGGACRWRRIWRERERRRRILIRRGCCLSLEEIKQVMLLQELWNRWGLFLHWKRK